MIKLPQADLYRVFGYTESRTLENFISMHKEAIESLAGPIETVASGSGFRMLLTLDQAKAVYRIRVRTKASRNPPKNGLSALNALYRKKTKEATKTNGQYSSIKNYVKGTGADIKRVVNTAGDIRISYQVMTRIGLGAFNSIPKTFYLYLVGLVENNAIHGPLVLKENPTKRAHAIFMFTKDQWMEIAKIRYKAEPVDLVRAKSVIERAFNEVSSTLITDSVKGKDQAKLKLETGSEKAQMKTVQGTSTSSAVTLRELAQRSHIPLDALVVDKDGLRISHFALASDALCVFDCTRQSLALSLNTYSTRGVIPGKIEVLKRFPKKRNLGRPSKHTMLTEGQWLEFTAARLTPHGKEALDKARNAIKTVFNEARDIVAQQSKEGQPNLSIHKTSRTPNATRTAKCSAPVLDIKEADKGKNFVQLSYLARELGVSVKELKDKIGTEGENFPVRTSEPDEFGYINTETAMALICGCDDKFNKVWENLTDNYTSMEKAGGPVHVAEMRDKIQGLLTDISLSLSAKTLTSGADAVQYVTSALQMLGESLTTASSMAFMFIHDIIYDIKEE